MRNIRLTAIFLVSVLIWGCATVGIEKTAYNTIQKEGNVEIREYQPYIVAETTVKSDFKESGNIAFRRLFAYISGENRSKEKIPMTAPVNQQPRSEKIAMTAPVNQQPAGDKFVVSFVMPAKYTMDTIPEPTNDTITIRQIPKHTVAAIRYSGSWSKEKYDKHEKALYEFIAQNDLTATAEPVFARYDPPFQLPFMRRNEVLIEIEDK